MRSIFKYSIYLWIIPLAVLVFTRCGDGEEVEPARVNLSVPQLAAGTGELHQFISVTSAGQWSIKLEFPEGESGWATVSPSEGTGSRNNIVLTVRENESEQSRRVNIILSADGKTVSRVLTQAGVADDTENGTGVTGWMELPLVEDNDSCLFVTHFTSIGGRTVRNFSLYYNTNQKIAHWVAYPHNAMYTGSSGRTDDWVYDTKIPQGLQARAARGISGYDRGHQIPSMDRTANEATNAQTFYYTNMTPQLSGLNQKLWMYLETKVKNTWMPAADTLYVVTGAITRTVDGNETIRYARDNDGELIAVPNYYFKVLLSYRNGSYEKAIGFWIDHKGADRQPDASDARSVEEIEQLTGFTFFENLPQSARSLKTAFRAQEWGL